MDDYLKRRLRDELPVWGLGENPAMEVVPSGVQTHSYREFREGVQESLRRATDPELIRWLIDYRDRSLQEQATEDQAPPAASRKEKRATPKRRPGRKAEAGK